MIQLKYKIFLLFILSLAICPGITNAQSKTTTLEVKVVDQEGLAIPGAVIYAQEGTVVYHTNIDGAVIIVAYPHEKIRVEAVGYESVLSIVPSENEMQITLQEYSTLNKEAVIPFGVTKTRLVSSNAVVLDIDEIRKYDNTWDIERLLMGKVPGYFGNTDISGMVPTITIDGAQNEDLEYNNALIVVDGIPIQSPDDIISRPIDFELMAQEIDKITILKDGAAATLYGTRGIYGAILIQTKRGTPNKKVFNVYTESGLQLFKQLPSYLNTADYYELFNKALVLDGQEERYSPGYIDTFRYGFDPVLYPSEDLLDDRFIKSYLPSNKIMFEFSGGTEKARYYTNLNYRRTGNEFKIGNSNFADNKFNIRGNLWYDLNNWLSVSMDAVVNLGLKQITPNTFWAQTQSLKPDQYAFLIPAERAVNESFLELANEDGYLIGAGITSGFWDPVYGQFESGSYSNKTTQSIKYRTGLNFDFSSLTPGLTGTCFFAFEINRFFEIQMNNDIPLYFPYKASETSDSLGIMTLTKLNRADALSGGDLGFARSNSFYSTLNYERVFDKHLVNSTLVGYRDQQNIDGAIQTFKTLHFGLRALYAYDNTYMAELNLVANGSSKLFGTENRWGYTPSIALGWVLSEESYLNTIPQISHLKLNARYGISVTDKPDNLEYYAYEGKYAQSDYDHWYGGSIRRKNDIWRQTLLSSPLLSFEKRRDISMGIDLELLDKLWLETDVISSIYSGEVIKESSVLPNYYGQASAFVNSNMRSYNAINLNLSYSDNFAGVQFTVGVNASFLKSKNLNISETEKEEDYLYKEGNTVDAIYGYEAAGFYTESDFDLIEDDKLSDGGVLNKGVTYTEAGKIRPGDIKYIDQNGDTIINELDIVPIGNKHPSKQVGVYATVSYKNFSLLVAGHGKYGSQIHIQNNYYYNKGQGKWSSEAYKNWTPQTAATAEYPRLTMQTSAYTSGNEKESTFWLYNDNWFQLSTVQLSYDLPLKITERIGIKGARVYLRGEDLIMFSKIKDKKEVKVNNTPYTRNVAVGLNLKF